MKILTVRSVLPDMGPGTQPLTIAKAMRDLGHETVFASAGGSYAPVIEEARFRVARIPGLAPDKHNPWAIAGAVRSLARLIREVEPDVIHGHNAAATICAYVAGRLAGRTLPCATSVRGVEERSTHQWRNRIWKQVPGVLLGVCENTRQRLLSFGCDPAKVIVTYNGIDANRFDATRYNCSASRQEFGFHENDVVVGTIGAMTGPDNLAGPGKGQHILVQAAAMLRPAFPRLRVLLVGDGPHRAKVEHIVDKLDMRGHVVFAGRRFDAPEMLAAMDIYALPSIHGEFFPNSILEAMSFGRPWVGSDIAGLSELTADGEAGQVVRPNDAVALADALRPLLADPALRQARGARGRREIESQFTIEKVCARILRAYCVAGAARAG